MRALYISMLCGLLSNSVLANTAEEDMEKLVGMMVYTKVAGGCDFSKRLSDWQSITNNKRSLADKLNKYEEARLGITHEQTVKMCEEGSFLYQTISSGINEDSDTAFKKMFDNAFLNGYCGMIFISATIFENYESAEKFVRFISSEAVRLDYSGVEELTLACKAATKKYNDDMAVFGYTP